MSWYIKSINNLTHAVVIGTPNGDQFNFTVPNEYALTHSGKMAYIKSQIDKRASEPGLPVIHRIDERIVEVPKIIEKIVEVPTTIEKIVPIDRIVEVPTVIEKIIEVPVDRIIEIPREVIREVPVEKIIETEKIVEVRIQEKPWFLYALVLIEAAAIAYMKMRGM